MGVSNEIATPVARSLDNNGSDIIQVQNADELRLAQMGAFLQAKTSTMRREAMAIDNRWSMDQDISRN